MQHFCIVLSLSAVLLTMGCKHVPPHPPYPPDVFECAITVKPAQVYVPPGMSDDAQVCVVGMNYQGELTKTCVRLGWLREIIRSRLPVAD